jgi:hypothetical protein
MYIYYLNSVYPEPQHLKIRKVLCNCAERIMQQHAENRYGQVIQENLSRPIRESKLEVIDARAKMTAPGTLTVYIGRKGTNSIDLVRTAVADDARAEELRTRIDNQLKQTYSMPVEHMPAAMIRQPVLADIRYGGETLIHGFFLPDGVDLFPVLLAYNGGALARQGFALIEHHREGTDAAFEAVVVRNPPSLNDAEEAALRQVPETQLVNNAAVLADWCDTTWWVVAAALVAAAAVTVEATCICAAMEAVHLPEDTLDSLGPAASARQLTLLRSQALAKSLH